jgi:hypothetical protein
MNHFLFIYTNIIFKKSKYKYMANFNSKFRAFGQALDLQQHEHLIQEDEIQNIIFDLYPKYSELNFEIIKIGENKFKCSFILENDDIEYIREDAYSNKDTNEIVDKIKKEKFEIESEMEILKENNKTLRSKYANSCKDIKKLEKLLEKNNIKI